MLLAFVLSREFSEMMRQCYPDADTVKVEKHIFRMYDANRDGDIDFRLVGDRANSQAPPALSIFFRVENAMPSKSLATRSPSS